MQKQEVDLDARYSRKPARTFEDLLVWKKAHEFVLSVYQFSAKFPQHELYGLTTQMRKAAVSIPSNIAEGFKKWGKSDKARFMNIAQGSVEECRYYVILSEDLGYGNTKDLLDILDEIGRILNAYRKSILRTGL